MLNAAAEGFRFSQHVHALNRDDTYTYLLIWLIQSIFVRCIWAILCSKNDAYFYNCLHKYRYMCSQSIPV